MIIKVLTADCSACRQTYELVEKVVKKMNNPNIQLILVQDIMEIMNYNILTPPAIVINEKVVAKGHIHSEVELTQLIETFKD